MELGGDAGALAPMREGTNGAKPLGTIEAVKMKERLTLCCGLHSKTCIGEESDYTIVLC